MIRLSKKERGDFPIADWVKMFEFYEFEYEYSKYATYPNRNSRVVELMTSDFMIEIAEKCGSDRIEEGYDGDHYLDYLALKTDMGNLMAEYLGGLTFRPLEDYSEEYQIEKLEEFERRYRNNDKLDYSNRKKNSTFSLGAICAIIKSVFQLFAQKLKGK